MTRPRRVVRDDTGEVFPSASAAARSCRASAADICRSARTGIRVHGATYSYADVPPAKEAPGGSGVWCLETGESFSSRSQAARMLGATRSQVSRCTGDLSRTVHGFHLLTHPPCGDADGLAECRESGIVRPTIREAFADSSVVLDECPPSLRGWADDGIHVYNPRSRGYRPGMSAGRAGRAVICPETGQAFCSIAAAASAAGVSCGSIARACDTHGQAAGLPFRWA